MQFERCTDLEEFVGLVELGRMKRKAEHWPTSFFSGIADLSQPSKLRIVVWLGQLRRAAERQPVSRVRGILFYTSAAILRSGVRCFFLATGGEDGD
jgi:hypothetical protein